MTKFEYLDSEKYFDFIRGHRNIICFGAGAKLCQALELLDCVNIKPTIICDSNPMLWGTTICYGEDVYEITDYDDIKNGLNDYIILLTMSSHNAWEVYQLLRMKEENGNIVQFCNPFKVDHFLLQSQNIEEHLNDYERFYNKLEDDVSKEIFLLNLQYKITGNMMRLYELTNGSTFFDKDIIGFHTNAVYVDVGAYTGDTVCDFLQYAGWGGYAHIYAFEADRGNYSALERFVKYGRIKNITLFNQALWSERGKVTFYSITDNREILYDSPNLFRSVDDAIDRSTLMEMQEKGKKYKQEEIRTEKLDDFLMGNKPTMMKVNALAADFEILKGSRGIIEAYKPIVILEHGVKPENLLDIMFFLSNIRSDYSFYLRQKDIFGDSKTVMYAV